MKNAQRGTVPLNRLLTGKGGPYGLLSPGAEIRELGTLT